MRQASERRSSALRLLVDELAMMSATGSSS
jgi:hypothetical protein